MLNVVLDCRFRTQPGLSLTPPPQPPAATAASNCRRAPLIENRDAEPPASRSRGSCACCCSSPWSGGFPPPSGPLRRSKASMPTVEPTNLSKPSKSDSACLHAHLVSRAPHVYGRYPAWACAQSRARLASHRNIPRSASLDGASFARATIRAAHEERSCRLSRQREPGKCMLRSGQSRKFSEIQSETKSC